MEYWNGNFYYKLCRMLAWKVREKYNSYGIIFFTHYDVTITVMMSQMTYASSFILKVST